MCSSSSSLTLDVFSFYRAITITLCSRLVLNLRGLILSPPYDEEDISINLDPLTFRGCPDGATIAAPNAMETVEDPEVDRRRTPATAQ